MCPLRSQIVLPQQKVRKIDQVRSTCVLVGLKDVQRFSLYLVLVSFGHYRTLAASQVTGRIHMEVTGLNLLQGAKFQRFLSGKNVFLNSKFPIREFYTH